MASLLAMQSRRTLSLLLCTSSASSCGYWSSHNSCKHCLKACAKCLIACLMLLHAVVLMGGCYNYELRYNGSHVDLHTELSNSLFGLYAVNEESVIMEEDVFGRVLYFYRIGSSMACDEVYGNEHIIAFLIMQKSDDDNVYCYSDINFIVRKRPETIPSSIWGAALLEEVFKIVPEEEIEELKAKNDWGKPIDESKCIKVKLARINRHYTEEQAGRNLVPQSIMQEVYDKMCIHGNPNIGAFFRQCLHELCDDQ